MHFCCGSSSFPECSFEELLAHVRRVAAAGNLQFPPTYSSSVQVIINKLIINLLLNYICHPLTHVIEKYEVFFFLFSCKIMPC